MTYQEALDFLFTATPVFQHIGGAAYKPGLARMQALASHYGNPHEAYPTIHIGGTNGKGSTSHTLAAILQSVGYRVGLFTSPHLVDFRERIRVNGEPITETAVCQFTEGAMALVEAYQPSFFELTCMMAFAYFREQEVDVAVIEVGLGGRLDCTNIIEPICSVITNISLDHTQYLGDTLEAIAGEKAGIIKAHTPVVVGSVASSGVRQVFELTAEALSAPIVFAEEQGLLLGVEAYPTAYRYDTIYGTLTGALRGEAQPENTTTILATLEVLRGTMTIPNEAIARGFAEVVELTGLMGRWQTLLTAPRLVCDTGHNEAGMRSILRQLDDESASYRQIHFVLGVAEDKDVETILSMLPGGYHYYFTRASVARALPAELLQAKALECGLSGEAFPTVMSAVETALQRAGRDDLVFVGGSNFVVADLLRAYPLPTPNGEGDSVV